MKSLSARPSREFNRDCAPQRLAYRLFTEPGRICEAISPQDPQKRKFAVKNLPHPVAISGRESAHRTDPGSQQRRGIIIGKDFQRVAQQGAHLDHCLQITPQHR